MGYSKEIYDKVEAELSRRRSRSADEADVRREKIYEDLPRVREIEMQLARTGVTAAKAVLKGGDTKAELERLRDENLRLQNELKVVLVSGGYTAADLEEKHICPKCADYGYIDGKMCDCMKKLLRDAAYKELNAVSPLALSRFETFDLKYYSDKPDDNGNIPAARMRKILSFCKSYAERFSPKDRSILMEGGTGLGKTHLSLAIARRVIDRGFGVIYCSSPNILSVLEREHFSRGVTDDTQARLVECDLLIIDDLGSEFATQFTSVTMYNLINTRLSQGKPCIINTNLSLSELKSRYSERFVSRLIGENIYFEFIGEDVRIQKARAAAVQG